MTAFSLKPLEKSDYCHNTLFYLV